jgi:hypothetical protein
MAIQCPLSLLSIISKLKAMSFLAISELKVLSSSPISDGDPPPFFLLSTLLELKIMSFVVLVFEVRILNSLAANDNDEPPPFSPLLTF